MKKKNQYNNIRNFTQNQIKIITEGWKFKNEGPSELNEESTNI